MNRIILLLTGTVYPGQMAHTKLLDPEVRSEHYISSLNYWLEHTAMKIVFVENSGADLSQYISDQYKNRIEFLTFNGNNYSKSLGKGYGELKCIHYAALHSQFFKEAEFIFKITGRYKVLNFKRFVDHYQKNNSIYVFLDFKDSLTFADSRLFGFKPEFITNYLIQWQEQINDENERFFENMLAKAALQAIVDEKNFRQLPYYPRFSGISGTANEPYESSYLFFIIKQLKFFLKSRFITGY